MSATLSALLLALVACPPGTFNSAAGCEACPLGASCSDGALEIVAGFYRFSNTSTDLRRCPDAGSGALSGCRGGLDVTNQCQEGLFGAFCRSCEATGTFYEAASASEPARCTDCSSRHRAAASAVGTLVGACMVAALLHRQIHTSTRGGGRTLWWMLRANTLVRITVGFYQISLNIAGVYQAKLPMDLSRIVTFFAGLLCFGLGDGSLLPLSCLGISRYAHRLAFWTLTPLLPLAALGTAAAIQASRERSSTSEGGRQMSITKIDRMMLEACLDASAADRDKERLLMMDKMLDGMQTEMASALVFRTNSNAYHGRIGSEASSGSSSRPRYLVARANILTKASYLTLFVAFLYYPIVTTQAFNAFPCHHFAEGSVAAADVSLTCDGSEHQRLKWVAAVAIAVYSVGLPVTLSGLLWRARFAIRSKRPSVLSRCLVAIWADYKPEFYWWELTELCRRFILLGLFVNLSPGSVLQLMLGTVVSAAYLVLQLFAQPFKLTSLNYTSGLASFSIVVFFISALIFKVNALVDQHEVSIAMT